MTSAENRVPVIIRNEIFYAFARVCMVLASLIGMPTAGFMLSRVIATADDIRDQVQKQNTALLLLSAEVKYHYGSVDDHEQRLRKLEARVTTAH